MEIYDLIIIGAGPAGVSAGIYAARQRLKILMISKDIGGQVAKKAVDIENYPGFEKISGPDLVELYRKQIKFNNLEVTHGEVINIKTQETSDKGQTFIVEANSGKNYEGISVIIASGAQSRKIGVPGEEEFEGKGVSYCSLCDGPIFRGKTVVVIGGGNNGFESAVFLSNYVNKVYILEYSDTVKADAENQELVAGNKNIEVILNAKIKKIEGKTLVSSVTYEDVKENQEKTLEVNGVFVEIGYIPATSFAKDLVDLDDKNQIIFDPKTMETKTKGLFSAGDCNVSKHKQIVTASGQGAMAALSAYEYIKKQHIAKNHYE